MVTIINYTYTLECGHTQVANVQKNANLRAYKMGDMLTCPKDHFAKKKVTDVSSVETEV